MAKLEKLDLTIAKIEDYIFHNKEVLLSEGLTPFKSFLDQTPPSVVISKLAFSSSFTTFQLFMIAYINYWSNLSIQDWIAVLELLKNKDIALYNFIPFATKYLHKDFFKIYTTLEAVSQESIEFIRDGIEVAPVLILITSYEKKTLDALGIKEEVLQAINNKLDIDINNFSSN